MAALVQSSVKDLRRSHVIRTSRSPVSEAMFSSQKSYLRSPNLGSIRPDFDMELSLEMEAEVNPTGPPLLPLLADLMSFDDLVLVLLACDV